MIWIMGIVQNPAVWGLQIKYDLYVASPSTVRKQSMRLIYFQDFDKLQFFWAKDVYNTCHWLSKKLNVQ